MAAAHLVELTGQVEGHHRFLARALGAGVDLAHHRADPLLERAMSAVGLELVVFDEVDAAVYQLAHFGGGLFGVESDAGLDDGADQRPARHPSQSPRALDAESWARVGGGERGRQRQACDAQA